MSRFDGLNLPQLIELMHEVVQPEPVSRLPQTVGWWVVLGWLVAVGLLFAARRLRAWRRNRYRRDALTLLAAIEADAQSDPGAAAIAVAELVKRTALAAYPRERVASLYGDAWAQFLVASANDDAAVRDAAIRLATAAYRRDADGRELVAPARRWIRLHRA